MRYGGGDDGGRTLALPSGGERVEVHAGLPSNDRARGIAGYPEQSTACAWDVEYHNVADRHDATREREVALGRPNLVLVRGDQPRDQLSALKILELVRDASGKWSIDDRFVPAVCQIGTSESLMRILRTIDERLCARLRVLDERRNRMGAVSDFGPSELSQFLLLQTLRPAQAVLGHMIQTGSAHPERAFVELRRLVASLSGFHPDAAAPELPAYSHEDLATVFGSCEQAVSALLSDAVPSQMAGVTLVNETESLRVARDLSPKQLHSATFFLAVRFDADDPTWVSQFARQVKIGAREDIELIVGSALQGVPAVHVQRPPNRLPIKSGYEYFRLETGGDFWQRIQEHQTLALFVPRDFAAAQIDVLTIEE